jgi:hypothetical protein
MKLIFVRSSGVYGNSMQGYIPSSEQMLSPLTRHGEAQI